MHNDDEIVVFWSDRMYQLAKLISRKFSRSWFLEPEDLEQEAYCGIAYWISIKSNEPVTIKLFTKIVRNRMHAYRKTFRKPNNRLPMNLIPEPVEQDDKTDLRLDVTEALEAATPKQRMTLFSQFYDEMSQADIAKALGLSTDGVGHRNYSARKKLKERLITSYGPLEDRKIKTKRPRKQSGAGRHVNWLAWGKIPNQRED